MLYFTAVIGGLAVFLTVRALASIAGMLGLSWGEKRDGITRWCWLAGAVAFLVMLDLIFKWGLVSEEECRNTPIFHVVAISTIIAAIFIRKWFVADEKRHAAQQRRR